MSASSLKVLEVQIDDVSFSEIRLGTYRATRRLDEAHSRLPKIPVAVEPFSGSNIGVGKIWVGYLNHHLKSGKIIPQVRAFGHGWRA